MHDLMVAGPAPQMGERLARARVDCLARCLGQLAKDSLFMATKLDPLASGMSNAKLVTS